jgi:tape measure domain-containing protein
MSTTTVDVLARLRADTTGFTSGINQASASAGGLNAKVSGHLAQMGAKFQQLAMTAATAMSAAIGVVAVPALMKGWDRLTTIQDSTVAIGVALGDTTKAAKLLDEVLTVVRGTPFNFDQFASAAQQMVGMGVDAEKIPRYLTAIGEASATQGKRANEYASRLATVFGQVSAANRIMGDDVQSFQEVGVNALAILGNSFNVTTSEMREMISKGLIPANQALDILSDGILNGTDGVNGATVAFTGTMAGLRKTLSGAVGGVSAATARLGAAFLQPLQGPLVTAANTATAALDKLAVYAKKLGTALAESKAMKIFISYLEKIPDKIGPVLDGIVSMKTTLAPLLGLILALASTNVATAFGPLGALIPNISPLVGILLGLATQSAPLRDAFKDLMVAMQPVIKSLIDALMPIMDQLGELISTTLAPALVKLAPPFIELIAALIPVIPPLIDLAVAIIPLLADVLIVLIDKGLKPMVDAIVPLIDWFADLSTKFLENEENANLFKGSIVLLIAALATYKTVTFITGALDGMKASLAAARVANQGLTVSQWALNAAMTANPIGLLVAAIAVLIGFVVLVWVKWDTIWGWIMDHKAYAIIAGFIFWPIATIVLLVGALRTLWDNWDKIWNWISEKAMWAWGYLKVAWDAIVGFVMGTLVPIFITLWEKIQEVWDGITAAVVLAWENFIYPAFTAIVGFVTGTLVPIFQKIWDVVQIVWSGIAAAINFAWKNVIEPVFNYFKNWLDTQLIPVLMHLKNGAEIVWNAIATAVSWAWNNVIQPIFNFIVGLLTGDLIPAFNKAKDVSLEVWDKISMGISWAWNNIIQPIWNVISWYISNVLMPVFNVLKTVVLIVFGVIAKAISFAWKNVIEPIWKVISWYVSNILMPVFRVLWTVVSFVFGKIAGVISWAWNNIIWPVLGLWVSYIGAILLPKFNTMWEFIAGVFQKIGAVISFTWNSVIQPVWNAIVWAIGNVLIPYYQMLWNAIKTIWGWISGAISFAWNNVIKPIWDAIVWFIQNVLIPYYEMLWNAVSTVWGLITGAISGAWNVISGVFDSLKNGITTVKDWISDRIGDVVGFFTGMGGRIKSAAVGMFDGVKEAMKTAINWIIEKWNGLELKTPEVFGWGPYTFGTPDIDKWQHTGGLVQGSMSSQNVPTMLQAGELVISRAQLKAIERGTVPEVSGSQGVVNVYVSETNASPYDIGKEILWSLKVAR